MANRTIQQKMLKMKRRNRHAVFSGETSKYAEKAGPIPFTEDANGSTKTGQVTRILVGPVSLSRAVINTGRGPEPIRMQEYYQRIHSYDEALPETIGAVPIDKLTTDRRSEGGLRLKDFDLGQKYAEFIKGVPKDHRIRLVDNITGLLDLYFNVTQWFFVDVDYKTKRIRRSKIYASKKFALKMLELKSITWVEHIPK